MKGHGVYWNRRGLTKVKFLDFSKNKQGNGSQHRRMLGVNNNGDWQQRRCRLRRREKKVTSKEETEFIKEKANDHRTIYAYV
jgi:hypothetical protein